VALKRRRFTREFKLQVLREIEVGKPIAQAAREHELHPNLITRWRSLHSLYAQQAFAGNGNTYKQEARIAELEPLVGRLSLEVDATSCGLQIQTTLCRSTRIWPER